MKLLQVLPVMLVGLSPNMTRAHHSFAASYDPVRLVTVEGIVTELQLVNPHAIIYMNVTNDAGDVLHEQWVLLGKSPPVLMGQTVISDLTPARAGDADCDGDVDLDDYALIASCHTGPDTAILLGCGFADIDGDGDADMEDHAAFQLLFDVP